jgi:hypothetical protein
MSYGVAVWDGAWPDDELAAAAQFETSYAQLRPSEPPSRRIRRFVNTLLDQHPDLTELDNDEVDDSPWADGPLIGNSSGSFIYIALVPSKANSTLPFIAASAREQGLVAFDPQARRMLTGSA